MMAKPLYTSVCIKWMSCDTAAQFLFIKKQATKGDVERLTIVENAGSAHTLLMNIGLWILAVICVTVFALTSYWLSALVAKQPGSRRGLAIYFPLIILETVLSKAFVFVTGAGILVMTVFTLLSAGVVFQQRKLALVRLAVKLMATIVALEVVCGLLVIPVAGMGFAANQFIINQMNDFLNPGKIIGMYGFSTLGQVIVCLLILLCRRASHLIKCNRNGKSWLYARVFIRLGAMVFLGAAVLNITTATFLPLFADPDFLTNNAQYVAQVALAAGLLLVAVSYLMQDIRYIQQLGRNETLEHQQAISRSTLQNLRFFRHNMINMIYGLEGVMLNGSTEELRAYYHDMEKKCALVNNENIIALERLSHPAISAVLLRATDAAREKELPISLYVQEGIRFARGLSAGEICQVLGVLLDNALEAAEQSAKPFVMVEIRNVDNMLEMIVKNTYAGQIDGALLGRGGHSTKEGHMGQGLLSCYHMLNHKNTAFLNFDVSEHFVRAQLLIKM